jgi:glutamine amidotransferase
MCRHLGYSGPPRPLSELVLEAPHSLLEQSYQPRLQKHGLVNADGFGVGWYVDGQGEAVRYRQARPIWSDASFASIAPTIHSPILIANVRSATEGTALDETAAAPFRHGRWLFSLNGRLFDWPRARKELWGRALDVPEARAAVDTSIAFALAVEAWSGGATLGDGLAHVVTTLAGHGDGRLNLLASDGAGLAATRHGEDLFVRRGADYTVVASEPTDDSEDWELVPDHHVVTATAGSVTFTPIPL